MPHHARCPPHRAGRALPRVIRTSRLIAGPDRDSFQLRSFRRRDLIVLCFPFELAFSTRLRQPSTDRTTLRPNFGKEVLVSITIEDQRGAGHRMERINRNGQANYTCATSIRAPDLQDCISLTLLRTVDPILAGRKFLVCH